MSFGAWLKAHYDEKGPVRWLAFFLEVVSASVLFFLMALTCVDVFGRYLFNSPIHGGTEMTEIGLAVMVFAAMPVITWRGGHIVVDLLDRFLGSKIVKVLSLLAALVMSSSLYFLALRIFELGERSIRRGVVTEFLAMPSGYIVQYIAIMSWATALGMITYGVYRILFQDQD
ncbi:TRAP transporter small permease [Marinobacterium marinum]|uniref:TRAP transporter small permease protein n=1 Tax=Marinobacterium marinum TaxID=2756129 RepID=A0A7W1WZR4_9GAMM|nr:TRAP transporter small permease [Marinobacterium marinum]MBA4501563.1 TRAP transporter small permease [Marinobacterium marinum]MBA4502527.1 TRAP transporter small permease [Marinobacterium marinum]MBA4502530.1 TRAP transporter small permease [Marinobacterium marinum]MBA4503230.1 TRAP transporter small permease [Marinobacterium marinum]